LRRPRSDRCSVLLLVCSYFCDFLCNKAATFSFLDKVFRRAHSPPRRGGECAATSKKWIRSDLSRTGWSVRRPFERPAELTTITASRYRARAPRPPLRGGE